MSQLQQLQETQNQLGQPMVEYEIVDSKQVLQNVEGELCLPLSSFA